MTGYATVSDVRDEVVQTVQYEVYVLSSASGSITTPTQITLKDQNTKALTAVSRNGTVMGSGYAFVKPNKITFSPALTDGDVIEVTRDALLTDAQIQRYIDYVTNVINSALVQIYAVPFTSTPPFINTLCLNLTAAILRKRLFDSTGKEGDRRGQMLWDEWTEMLQRIVDRKFLLLDSSGIQIAALTHGMLVDPTLTPIFNLDEPKDILYLPSSTGVHPEFSRGR